VRGATIVFHDITELERDQRALRKTLLEQQAILENAAVGILFTKDATVQECNIRCAEMLGYSRQELEGGSTNQVFPSEAEFIELGRAAGPLLVQGLSFKREAQLRRKDGTLFWARLYGRAIDPSHTADGTIWIVEDINEHRIDEEKLRARCWSMQAIMDNAPLAIVFQRDTASCAVIRFAECFGFSAKRGGAPDVHAVPVRCDVRCRMAQALPLLASGKPYQAEMEMRRRMARLSGRTRLAA
jgi:PAS domain S-box-containing protein